MFQFDRSRGKRVDVDGNFNRSRRPGEDGAMSNVTIPAGSPSGVDADGNPISSTPQAPSDPSSSGGSGLNSDDGVNGGDTSGGPTPIVTQGSGSAPAVHCFCTGTLIRTVRGDVAVEDLVVGNLLPILHGGARPIRWIGHTHREGTAIAGQFLALPVCVKANAFADGAPRRDLWVSPGHAFFLDGVFVHAYSLINGRSIVQAEDVESVTYWHVELDEHEVIFAEGCATESYLSGQSDRSDAVLGLDPPRPADLVGCRPHSCAPLLKDGPHLDAIQRRIAARAWIDAPSAAEPGRLLGYMDCIEDGMLNGWARNEEAPDVPVYLDILVDERRFARVLANRYRADLRAAGFGSGCCAFTVAIPAEIKPDRIAVRRSVDGTELKRSDAYATQAAEWPESTVAGPERSGLRLVHAA